MANDDKPDLQNNPTIVSQPELVVYFDGGCPLCEREIAFYRKLDHAKKIQWEDVSNENTTCPIGLDRETLLARFHVKELATGKICSGASGFARLWCSLPGIWRNLGQIAKLPGVCWLLESGYILTLKIRPWLARHLKHSAR
jgi:predicted DCC family thiol-disulfide oxidoreductase YuxK